MRQAVSYAIDRRFIVEQLHRGASRIATGPIAPGSRCTLLLRPTPDEEWLKLEVKAVYSSYTAPGDFRIGMAFLPQDAAGRDRLRAVATARA